MSKTSFYGETINVKRENDMTNQKIFLVKQKLSRRDEDTEMWIYDFDNQVELTKEEIDHIKNRIGIELVEMSICNLEKCKICSSVFKKLEGLNGSNNDKSAIKKKKD